MWQVGAVSPVSSGGEVPVSTAERVGEQRGLAVYARSKSIPRLASRSRFGVS